MQIYYKLKPLRDKVSDLFLSHQYRLLFFLIVLLGIVLRGYNFSSWLHFELDQARDANIISEAYQEGAGELPLLGPRAGGTYLRLGPIFYYLEYLSALISSPRKNPAPPWLAIITK